MSVSRMLTQQVEGLETLRSLLTANPKDIIAAHEEARKQVALTDAEEAKADEGRAFITQAALLKADIEKKQAALVAEREQLDCDKVNHEAKVKDEWQRISDENARLVGVAGDHAETDKRHIEERKALDVDAKKLKEASEAARSKVSADMVANEEDRMKNETEAARLAAWEQTLKAKAASVRQNLEAF